MGDAICGCLVWGIPENHKAIITKLGAYHRTLDAGGPYCINPLFYQLQQVINMKQRQLKVKVFGVVVQVQYKVIDTEEGVKDAAYKLSDPSTQIKSYVEDVLRSILSRMSTKRRFNKKDEIARKVYARLKEKMKEFGYEIKATLVTDIMLSEKRKKSFGLRNLNKYYKEADKFRQMIKTSEKNAKSQALNQRDKIIGGAIAQQRQEIVDGLKTSIDAFTGEVTGVTARDVLELVLVTQYFDMLKDIGAAKKSTVILTPGGEEYSG